MSIIPLDTYQTINETIAKFLSHETPLNYTEQLGLAWLALDELQELGYGFTMSSLGRSTIRMRIVRWAGHSYSHTSTGEYIVDIVDGPAPLAICRAIVEAIAYENLQV